MNDTPQPLELGEQIVSAIAESLKSFGFQHGVRHCRVPKYGKGAYIVEEWEAETLAAFIVGDVERLFNTHTKALLTKIDGELPKGHSKSNKLKQKYDIRDFMNGYNQAIQEAHQMIQKFIEEE